MWLLDENGWSFSISAFGENLTGTHDPLIMIEQLGPNDLPVSNYPVSGRVGEQLTGLLFGMPGTPWFLAGIQKDQAWIVSGFSDSLEVGTVAVPPQSLRVPLSIEVKDRLKIDLLVPMVASTTLFPGMITGLPGDSLQIYMRGINWNVSNDLIQLSGLPGKAGSNSKAGNFIFRSISTDKKSTARGIFTPILDSITYNDFEELNAEILVLGYADKQVISDQDSLYLVLLSQGKDSIQATEAYYKTLSYLRAKEIGDIILSQLNNYTPQFSRYKQVVLNIIIEGRGTESPDPKKTYLPEDDKRRIVKLYWKIN